MMSMFDEPTYIVLCPLSCKTIKIKYTDHFSTFRIENHSSNIRHTQDTGPSYGKSDKNRQVIIIYKYKDENGY